MKEKDNHIYTECNTIVMILKNLLLSKCQMKYIEDYTVVWNGDNQDVVGDSVGGEGDKKLI